MTEEEYLEMQAFEREKEAEYEQDCAYQDYLASLDEEENNPTNQ